MAKGIGAFAVLQQPRPSAAGTAGALLGAALNLLITPDRRAEPIISGSFGAVCFWITLFFWKPRCKIFLDKVCVSQTDEELKRRSILSLGAILANSRRMLLLWDPTYITRLWCVLELASYSKLRQNILGDVHFRPLMQSTVVSCMSCSMSLFLIFNGFSKFAPSLFLPLTFISVLVPVILAAHFFRRFAKDIAFLSEQLRNFSTGSANCFCCTANHIHPGTGAGIPCDRVPVEETVKVLFGSTSRFDEFVQTDLAQRFKAQSLLLWRHTVVSCLPFFWFGIGLVVSYMRTGDMSVAVFKLGDSIGNILVTGPVAMDIGLRVVHLAKNAPMTGVKGVTVTIGTSIVVTVPLVAIIIAETLGEKVGEHLFSSTFIGRWLYYIAFVPIAVGLFNVRCR